MIFSNQINNLLSSLIGVSLLLISSCGPSVKTVKTGNKDLSNYQSFAYLPNTNATVPDKKYTDEKINRSIIKAVQINMEKNGFIINREEPDLLVLISTYTDLNVEKRTTPVYATYPYSYNVGTVGPYYDSNYYYGYPSYSTAIGYNTDTYTYKEGTLIIDLIDRKSKKVVWKGVASDDIYGQPSTEAIQAMVDDIFAELSVK